MEIAIRMLHEMAQVQLRMEFNMRDCTCKETKTIRIVQNNSSGIQGCQVAVVTATLLKCGRRKIFWAVENWWPYVAVKWP